MIPSQRATASLCVLLLGLLAPQGLAQSPAQPPNPPAESPSAPPSPPAESDLQLVAPTDLSIDPIERYRFHSFSTRWDNDGSYPKPFGDSDRHYTNGSKFDLAWTPPSDWQAPDWWLGRGEGSDADPDWQRFALGLTIEQRIYTGRDIKDPNPPKTDRPYAGYGAVGLYAQRASATTHDHVQLNIGVVGKSSYAEDIQEWVHSTFPRQDTPQGWETQLNDEPILNITLARTWKTPPSQIDGVAFEFLPAVSVDLGNAYTRANLDLTLRIGPSLPDDFGPGRLLAWRDATGTGWGESGWAWYAYTRMGVRAVARDITLDGNTFEDSRSVDSNAFVGELELGLRARHGNLEIGYQLTTITAEFDTQDGPDSYGEISLTLYF